MAPCAPNNSWNELNYCWPAGPRLASAAPPFIQSSQWMNWMALLCLAAACDALVLRSIKPNQFMFCFIDFSSLHQFHKIIQVDWFDFTLLLLEGLFAAVFSSGRSHWRCSAHNQPKRESSQPFPSFALLNSIQTPQRAPMPVSKAKTNNNSHSQRELLNGLCCCWMGGGVNLYFFQLTHSQQSTIRSWRSNVYNYCYNIFLFVN